MMKDTAVNPLAGPLVGAFSVIVVLDLLIIWFEHFFKLLPAPFSNVNDVQLSSWRTF